jgi:radical S-adenosyl methionine domain-containing protein 2
VPLTQEELRLEKSRAERECIMAVYRSLKVEGQRIAVCNASGSKEEVCSRVVEFVKERMTRFKVPVSVNWHYTRQCNYKCKFCFHTATNDDFLPKSEEGMAHAKRSLRQLAAAGMRKINFSGGEPFLHPKQLGELCRFCKQDLRLESVSIISNGSKITKRWMQQHADHVDILGISCDSFQEHINKQIGRGSGMHLESIWKVRQWCDEFDVLFKLNSVINSCNVDEDMRQAVEQLNPVRWKVFQCLLIDGENAGEGALRDAKELVISEEQFNAFLTKHASVKCLIPESNLRMKDSYLILDEKLRFLNCTGGAKKPSRSLLEVSLQTALSEAGFDEKMFQERGGVYDWSKPRDHGYPEIEDLGGGIAKAAPPSASSLASSCVKARPPVVPRQPFLARVISKPTMIITVSACMALLAARLRNKL